MTDIVPRAIDPHYHWWVKTAPTVLPVSVEDVKLFARIDTDAEDDLLETMIGAVTDATEKWLGRALLGQTLVLSFDQWPGDGVVRLPRPPFLDLVEIRSLDEDEVSTVYASTNYLIRPDILPAEIVLRSDGPDSPSNADRYHGGWEIEFRAGYGDLATDVPASIRAGVMAWAAEYYESRILSDSPPKNAHSLLMLNKIIRF